uniref:Uncharacterized protein n=1 Tax=Timema shepardi TaxID=629360 RepID=A0A7R9G1D5_TIMSH|nr:unnamed protein product [Timema shepardi]
MSMTVHAEEPKLSYLKNLTKHQGYIAGLIIGQATDKHYFVIHLARTPSSLSPKSKYTSIMALLQGKFDSADVNPFKNVFVIPENNIVDHARFVTRMLPGGMRVLGIFLVSPGKILEDTKALIHIHSICTMMDRKLSQNTFLHGNCLRQRKLVLHMCSQSYKTECGMLGKTPKGSIEKVFLTFQSQPFEWYHFGCRYKINKVFPLGKINMVLAMKHHLMSLLKSVNRDVMNDKWHWACNQMAVVLVLPCDHEQQEEVEITPCSSGLCIKGNLGSSVFMHDKSTVCELVRAIKQDIVRSLASRFEIYCDYFLEEKCFSQEYTVLHNPPKRVFIPLPGSVVTFSDYLFPEDRRAEAFISFHKVLDVNVESEGIVDFEDNAHVSIEVNVSNTNIEVNENERMSTVSGMANALVVLSSTAEDGEIKVRISVG